MKKTIYFFTAGVIFLFSACGGGNGRKHDNKPDVSQEDNTIVATTEKPTVKPTVNVYLENSGSMAGYVSGNSAFKDAVYNYLTDIKISGITDTLNLFYINDKPVEKGSDIEDFINKLNPNQCVFATSDIADIFGLVLNRTDENKISVFVTDGIFSPGKKDAIDYLVHQQIGVKRMMAEHLTKYPNTAIMVYQLSSNFYGTYYNRKDAKTTINAPRPYYIWVIGDVSDIERLKMYTPETSFKGGGIKHSFTLLPSFEKQIDYAILNAPKFGSFERDKNSPKNSIYKIKKEGKGKHKGKFMFTIGMDLSLFSILLGDEYLMNTDSYDRLINKQPNNDYFIEMEHNTNPNTNYTHNMKLTTNKISTGELEIILRNNLPDWVSEINDDEGLDIHENNAINKTFGIKYLVEGIYEAYQMRGNEIYTTMKFNLKK